MKLTLVIDGKEKNFTAPFISGRMLRKTLDIAKTTNFDNVDGSTLDDLADYVCELFKGQFSQDEFYDGIEANKLLSTVIYCVNEVVGKVGKATEAIQDPNDQTSQ
jgi:hypothetical protein